MTNPVVIAAAAYVVAFVVLVAAGHEREWPGEYGFRYSRNETLDGMLGVLFTPLYVVARALGVQRLSQPQKSVP